VLRSRPRGTRGFPKRRGSTQSAIDGQELDDLLWIREPFLNSNEDLGKVVVHGHTPAEEPEVRDNRIGLDTGAVYGGKLTALVLEGEERRFLQV
jgi:serine/threonine protein phosphatase 1